jgi:purine-binding chemotaxis protein CheW
VTEADEDELAAFRPEAAAAEEVEEEWPEQRQLLLFQLGGVTFGVGADDVERVVPWAEPAPIPQGDARVRGVVQDRGRIITVLRHPTGRSPHQDVEPTRIVICMSRHGLVGLPAELTRDVVTVGLREGVVAGETTDSSVGVVTVIEPKSIVQSIVGQG